MQTSSQKTIAIFLCLAAMTVLSGCTNWKAKYGALNIEHQNTLGLLEREKSEKGQLAQSVAQGQQTIDELQRQIAEQQKSPAEASGFGEGYDVSFDAAAGTVTVTLNNSILFDAGKATLKSSTSAELDHIFSVLQSKYAGKLVDVVGHTDSDPIKKSKWKDNWELSSQRALSVVRYLISKGYSKDAIRAVGRGESQPIASNASVSGKAKNRRVEIVVHVR